MELGITDDYSMGYSDDIGFRAGIAQQFNWFDLEQDQKTNLIVHPFQVMDVTLKNYLKLSQEEAIEKVSEMINGVRLVGGEFCTLWHNSSLSEKKDWKGWTHIYEEIVKKAL